MDVIAGLPDCDGQAADAVTCLLHSGKNWKMLQDCSKFQNQSVQTSSMRYMVKIIGKIEYPVVFLERNLYGHPLAGFSWQRQFEEVLLERGRKKVPNCECLFVHRIHNDYSYQKTWMTSKWQERSRIWLPCGRIWWNMWMLTNPHHFLAMCTWDALSVWNSYCTIFEDVWITTFSWNKRKITRMAKTSRTNCGVVLWHGRTCSTMRWAILWSGREERGAILLRFKSCLDDHQFKEEELESVAGICSQSVLKCLYVARIERPHMWSVNKLARSVTKWAQACDRRLASVISHIHHTNDFRQYCHVGNAAQHCRLGLFQDSDFAGDLEDSKSTSGGVLCFSGSRTFVLPVGCARNKLLSRTESEIVSLDAGLRMDGLLALALWDMVIEILRPINNNANIQATRKLEQFLIPEPTELSWIGFLTESIWNPKSKSNYVDTKKPTRRHTDQR